MNVNQAENGNVKSGQNDIYFDVEGVGPALLLFHGGMGTVGRFGSLRKSLNRRWTTTGIEQQRQGHTADIDRPTRSICDGTTAGPIDFRLTVGFEQQADAWTIIHEHHSMPVTDEVMIGPEGNR